MSTQFYFSQKFRNKQIKTIFQIIQLPNTRENNIFINNLLIQINQQLFSYYYPRKPSYIEDEKFLNKLGDKGITEAINKIFETIRLREYEHQKQIELMKQQKQEQEKTKEEYESMIRPKLSNDDNVNPDDILAQKQREREEFDKTLPNRGNNRTPEDVGLVPQSTKKQRYKPQKETNEEQFNNQLEINQTQEQINNQSINPIHQQQDVNNPSNNDFVYKNDIQPLKPDQKPDFSKPINPTQLMPNMNSGDDNNYSPF